MYNNRYDERKILKRNACRRYLGDVPASTGWDVRGKAGGRVGCLKNAK